MRAAVQKCHGCDLYKGATQAVFGEGRVSSRVMFIGEQPGDVEDRAGRVFVGPAGRLLDRALTEAGFDRSKVYLTNAVKHFKLRPLNRTEIVACRPWLIAELNQVAPDLIVVLGSVAAQSILGPDFRVTRERGKALPWPASAEHPEEFVGVHGMIVATVHPSAVLRSDDREAAFAELVRDLKKAAQMV